MRIRVPRLVTDATRRPARRMMRTHEVTKRAEPANPERIIPARRRLPRPLRPDSSSPPLPGPCSRGLPPTSPVPGWSGGPYPMWSCGRSSRAASKSSQDLCLRRSTVRRFRRGPAGRGAMRSCPRLVIRCRTACPSQSTSRRSAVRCRSRTGSGFRPRALISCIRPMLSRGHSTVSAMSRLFLQAPQKPG